MSSVSEGNCVKGKWFVVYTQPRQEFRALENLQRQDYECFLPLIKTQKIRAGKCIVVTESLFPRYFFIRLFEGISNFAPIRSTRGVNGLVSFSGLPVHVSDVLIQSLGKLPLQEGLLFEEGDQLEVKSGPFAGVEAEFVGLHKIRDGEMRAIVLLQFLSKMQRVIIPLAELQKVD